MKISKPQFLIMLIFCLLFASGCAKSLPPIVDAEPSAEFFTEENVGEFDTSPSQGSSGKKETHLLNEGSDVEPFSIENGGDLIASLSPEEEARRRLIYRSSDHLLDMFFAFDMYDLDDPSLAILQKNVSYLKSHPLSKIEIQAHCDERGSSNYNIVLGEQRAHSVKSYLILLGIDADRIHTVSYGEEKPFCFESNEKCWYQNRRVRFLVAEEEEIERVAFSMKK